MADGVITQEEVDRFNANAVEKRKDFNRLTYEEKRVAVGREVLTLLGHSDYKIARGQAYLFAKVRTPRDPELRRITLAMLVPEMEECQVCAIGLAAIAKTKLDAGFFMSQTYQGLYGTSLHLIRRECFKALLDLFDDEEINTMESFFEDYSRRYLRPLDALKLFWETVIEHEGEVVLDHMLAKLRPLPELQTGDVHED